MTVRTLYTRLSPELAFTGHHRKDESVGEAVADLQRLTWEAFADVQGCLSQGFVIITLYATTPKADGHYRPRLPWFIGMATNPIFQALYSERLITADVWPVFRREWVQTAEEERVVVELRRANVGEEAA